MSVEDLLKHPLLWRGQDGGTAAAGGGAGEAAIATGFPALDAWLPGGGWPLGALSEICIDRYGVGELSVLMPALAALSRRAVASRQWIVWIAPPFVPYAPALAHHGIDLDRILLVHPRREKKGSEKKGSKPFSSEKGFDPFFSDPTFPSSESLWAVEQAIRSGSSLAVLAWVREADMPALRRLQLGAEDSRCWTVLFRPPAAAARNSPAALRFRLLPATDSMPRGEAGIQLEILKCRGRRPRRFLL